MSKRTQKKDSATDDDGVRIGRMPGIEKVSKKWQRDKIMKKRLKETDEDEQEPGGNLDKQSFTTSSLNKGGERLSGNKLDFNDMSNADILKISKKQLEIIQKSKRKIRVMYERRRAEAEAELEDLELQKSKTNKSSHQLDKQKKQQLKREQELKAKEQYRNEALKEMAENAEDNSVESKSTISETSDTNNKKPEPEVPSNPIQPRVEKVVLYVNKSIDPSSIEVAEKYDADYWKGDPVSSYERSYEPSYENPIHSPHVSSSLKPNSGWGDEPKSSSNFGGGWPSDAPQEDYSYGGGWDANKPSQQSSSSPPNPVSKSKFDQHSDGNMWAILDQDSPSVNTSSHQKVIEVGSLPDEPDDEWNTVGSKGKVIKRPEKKSLAQESSGWDSSSQVKEEDQVDGWGDSLDKTQPSPKPKVDGWGDSLDKTQPSPKPKVDGWGDPDDSPKQHDEGGWGLPDDKPSQKMDNEGGGWDQPKETLDVTNDVPDDNDDGKGQPWIKVTKKKHKAKYRNMTNQEYSDMGSEFTYSQNYYHTQSHSSSATENSEAMRRAEEEKQQKLRREKAEFDRRTAELREMGFPADLCRKAAQKFNSLDDACTYLYEVVSARDPPQPGTNPWKGDGVHAQKETKKHAPDEFVQMKALELQTLAQEMGTLYTADSCLRAIQKDNNLDTAFLWLLENGELDPVQPKLEEKEVKINQDVSYQDAMKLRNAANDISGGQMYTIESCYESLQKAGDPSKEGYFDAAVFWLLDNGKKEELPAEVASPAPVRNVVPDAQHANPQPEQQGDGDDFMALYGLSKNLPPSLNEPPISPNRPIPPPHNPDIPKPSPYQAPPAPYQRPQQPGPPLNYPREPDSYMNQPPSRPQDGFQQRPQEYSAPPPQYPPGVKVDPYVSHPERRDPYPPNDPYAPRLERRDQYPPNNPYAPQERRDPYAAPPPQQYPTHQPPPDRHPVEPHYPHQPIPIPQQQQPEHYLPPPPQHPSGSPPHHGFTQPMNPQFPPRPSYPASLPQQQYPPMPAQQPPAQQPSQSSTHIPTHQYPPSSDVFSKSVSQPHQYAPQQPHPNPPPHSVSEPNVAPDADFDVMELFKDLTQ